MLRIKTIHEATEAGELIAVGTERVVEAVPAHLVGKVLILGEVSPESHTEGSELVVATPQAESEAEQEEQAESEAEKPKRGGR